MTFHPAQLHPLVPLPEEVRAVLPQCGAQPRAAKPDAVIAAFCQAQDGVVARRQLLAAGLTRGEVGKRLDRSQLVARYRGVYAPGHLRLGLHGQRTAAVLAIAHAVLSHGSATALHGIGGAGSRWHVTVPGSGGGIGRGQIAVHTSRTLGPADVCVVDGIPATTVSRSIVDAAGYLSANRLANLLARAERASLLHLGGLRETLAQVRSRPTRGHALLSARLQEHMRMGAQLSRSDVETALRSIAVRADLPVPMLNRVVAGDEIDALWPEARLGIEIDSWEFHRDRRSFVGDRAKLRRLSLQGFVVFPYAGADILYRPDLVASELRAALRR